MDRLLAFALEAVVKEGAGLLDGCPVLLNGDRRRLRQDLPVERLEGRETRVLHGRNAMEQRRPVKTCAAG